MFWIKIKIFKKPHDYLIIMEKLDDVNNLILDFVNYFNNLYPEKKNNSCFDEISKNFYNLAHVLITKPKFKKKFSEKNVGLFKPSNDLIIISKINMKNLLKKHCELWNHLFLIVNKIFENQNKEKIVEFSTNDFQTALKSIISYVKQKQNITNFFSEIKFSKDDIENNSKDFFKKLSDLKYDKAKLKKLIYEIKDIIKFCIKTAINNNMFKDILFSFYKKGIENFLKNKNNEYFNLLQNKIEFKENKYQEINLLMIEYVEQIKKKFNDVIIKSEEDKQEIFNIFLKIINENKNNVDFSNLSILHKKNELFELSFYVIKSLKEQNIEDKYFDNLYIVTIENLFKLVKISYDEIDKLIDEKYIIDNINKLDNIFENSTIAPILQIIFKCVQNNDFDFSKLCEYFLACNFSDNNKQEIDLNNVEKNIKDVNL